jgi:hypothetical protein
MTDPIITATIVTCPPPFKVRLRYTGEPGTVTAVCDGEGIDVVIGPGVNARAIQTAMNDAVRGEWFHVEIVNPPPSDELNRPGPPRRDESHRDRTRRQRREARETTRRIG